jgi:hypothetical protein
MDDKRKTLTIRGIEVNCTEESLLAAGLETLRFLTEHGGPIDEGEDGSEGLDPGGFDPSSARIYPLRKRIQPPYIRQSG